MLIAGTNGKGSTAATLASILQASGLKTGLYTSPHLVRINERIRLNGQPIADDDFALLHDVVDRTAERLVGEGDLPWHPSFFEMLTAMAFEYFARSRPDMVVLEVGMGGRLDATNVVDPRLSIITDIALDHQKYLGETVAEIAREKAGIIRPGGVVVTLPQTARSERRHRKRNFGCRRARGECRPLCASGLAGSQYVQWAARQRAVAVSYPLEMFGQANHGRIAASRPSSVAQPGAGDCGGGGIARSGNQFRSRRRQSHKASAKRIGRDAFRWCRLQGDNPEYVFDVAHNPAGAWALRSTLSARVSEDAGQPRNHHGVWRNARQGDARKLPRFCFRSRIT